MNTALNPRNAVITIASVGIALSLFALQGSFSVANRGSQFAVPASEQSALPPVMIMSKLRVDRTAQIDPGPANSVMPGAFTTAFIEKSSGRFIPARGTGAAGNVTVRVEKVVVSNSVGEDMSQLLFDTSPIVAHR